MYKSNTSFSSSSSSSRPIGFSNGHASSVSTHSKLNGRTETPSTLRSPTSVKDVPIIKKSQLDHLSNGSSFTRAKDDDRDSSSGSSNASTSSSGSDVLTRGVKGLHISNSYRTDINPAQFPVKKADYSSLSQRGLVGLKNLGNTCFMNSVLQCLSNSLELLQFCLNDAYADQLNQNSSMKGNLFKSYAKLMQEMWSTHRTSFTDSVSPHSFKDQIQKFAPRFMGYSQQDAQEFLRYLLEGLHEDVNRVKTRPPAEVANYEEEDRLDDLTKSNLYWNRYLKRDNSVVVDLFMGQLMSTLECTECGYKSTTFDPFWDLSVPLAKKVSVDIVECLRLFTSKEELNGNEKPMCGRCKQRRRCHKWFNVQRFPKILVLHLKRFSGERFRSKMNTLVSYPCEKLDLGEFASPTCVNRSSSQYRLYAVSNHSGSCYGGHYTAYCRHPDSAEWAEFNDSRVRTISANSVVSSDGYVLFYQQM